MENIPEERAAHKAGKRKVTDHQVEKHVCRKQFTNGKYDARYIEISMLAKLNCRLEHRQQ